MSFQQLNISGGVDPIAVEERIQQFQINVGDFQVELGAFMWIEGLFEGDPGTMGLAGMKFHTLLTPLEDRENQILLPHCFLVGDLLLVDYIPDGWTQERLESFFHTTFSLLLPQGMWREQQSALLWASKGPRIVSREFLVPRYLPQLETLTGAEIAINRFYQQCYIPDQNRQPNKNHLRWVATIVNSNHELLGELICLHDFDKKEIRLMDRSENIPRPLASKLMQQIYRDHIGFLDTLTQ